MLQTAYRFARDLFDGPESDEDGVPLLAPETANRHGADPVLIRLPDLVGEAEFIAGRFTDLRDEGMAFRDMAIVYRSHFIGDAVAKSLARHGIPCRWLKNTRGDRQDAGGDAVKLVTMHSSKGLEFPVVAIPSVGFVPRDQRDLESEVRLTYVGMTRAMDHLVMSYHKETALTARLEAAMRPVAPAA